MPEGTLCNKKPIDTEEAIKTLLGDTGGRTYYEEMKSLDVDSELLLKTIQNTLKSRLKTWLEICAHCGMCADSCFLYLINDGEEPSADMVKTLDIAYILHADHGGREKG